MKILIINNRGTIHAGAEVMISQLCIGLRKKGHEVRVLAGDEEGDGQNISDYSFRATLRSFYLFNPFAIFALWRALRMYNPDIVHLHSVSKTSPFILLLLKNIPTVLTIHDHTVFDPTRIIDTPLFIPYKKTFGGYFIDHYSVRYLLEKVRFYFFRRFAKNIDIVFACSNFYAKCAEESGMFNKVRVLHNGIDLPEYKQFINYNKLLFVGRLEDEKGVHILLDAMSEIVKLHPNAKLDIVGSGKQEEKLKSQTHRLKLDNSVFFHGYEESHDVEKRYEETTLVIVPSLFPDNFPTVCLEAMAIGRPIVASKVGGIHEMVEHDQTGLLVTPGDTKGLSSAIMRMLENREEIERMSPEGVSRVKQYFSEEIYIDTTENEYSELLKKYHENEVH